MFLLLSSDIVGVTAGNLNVEYDRRMMSLSASCGTSVGEM